VRSDGWKYVKWSYGDEELYDLRADPGELVNLAADPAHADDLARMRAAEAELRRCRGQGCNTVEP
jgi:choline-sulfatase